MLKNFDLNKVYEKVIDKLYGWEENIILNAPNFILVILIFVIFWYLGKYLKYFIMKVLLQKVGQESIKSIIARTTFVITVMISFFSTLVILDLDKVLTSILAGPGVLGLALV